MGLEQALAVAVGCRVGQLGGFPSEARVWFLSGALAEIDLEVTSARELDLGFCLRRECEWWMCFEGNKPLHRDVKEIQLERWAGHVGHLRVVRCKVHTGSLKTH